MLRVIWRYILTLKIKMRIKDKHWNSVIFIIILEVFTKFCDWTLAFIRKGVYSLINDKIY